MVATELITSLAPIALPTGIAGTGIALLQTGIIASSYGTERKSPAPYSKFAHDTKQEKPISSRNGMFRIYVPATIASGIITAATVSSGSFSLASLLLLAHFLKRTLEVAFLHKYSGTMPSANANMIGTYYTLTALLVSLTAVPSTKILSPDLQTAGLVVFAIGQFGNFYHHYLLTTLRDKSNTTGYVAPKRGFFRFVATPHYFFELVGLLGIAMVAQHTHAFLTVASMTSYLAGRATLTNEMYMKKFDEEDWPRNRKAIIPGIF